MEWPLPLKLLEFSFEEDLLILSIYFSEPYYTLKEQIVVKYDAAHAKDPVRYPKQQMYTLNTNILMNRLISLVSDDKYANYREALVRVLGVQPIPVTDDYLSSKPLMYERALLTQEAEKYGKDKLRVYLPGASAPVYTTRRVQVCQNSDLLAREALAANENLTYEDYTLQVTLTEDYLACPVPHTPPHFSQELFERFLLFTRRPYLLSEVKLLDATLDSQVKEGDFLYYRVCDFLINSRKNRVYSLDAWRQRMEKAALDEITQEFAKAIEAMRIKYEKLAVYMLERLNDTHTELLVDAMEFYEAKQHAVRSAIQQTHQQQMKNDKMTDKRDELKVLRQAIFAPPEILPNLLVLGMALESRGFVLACEHEIAYHLADQRVYTKFIFAECQLLNTLVFKRILAKCSDHTLATYRRVIYENGSCKLFDFSNDSCKEQHRKRYGSDRHFDVGRGSIRSDEEMTIQMLQLQKYSTDEVYEMMRKSMKNQLIPLELVEDEIRARKTVFKDKYAKMSDMNIRELINKGNEPFPEVLQELLDERVEVALGKRKAIRPQSLLMLTASDEYTLAHEGCLATVITRNRYVRLRPTKLLSNRVSNLVYSEVYLETCTDCTVAVGVFLVHDENMAVYVTTDGYLQQLGQRRYLGFYVPERCVFGVLVDCRAQQVEFRINGYRIYDTEGRLLDSVHFDGEQKEQAGYQAGSPLETSLVVEKLGMHDSINCVLDKEAIKRAVVPTKEYSQALERASLLVFPKEREFYVGSEVYNYGRCAVAVRHIFGEPFMMHVPAGYGADGWV